MYLSLPPSGLLQVRSVTGELPCSFLDPCSVCLLIPNLKRSHSEMGKREEEMRKSVNVTGRWGKKSEGCNLLIIEKGTQRKHERIKSKRKRQ